MTGMRCCALAMTVLLLASACAAAAETITMFPIPIAADRIVTGSDGALWFTAMGNRNKLGRITTAGTVTEFLIPLPTRVFVYTGIAAGPDGALWFGIAKPTPGFVSRSIGRITTTGEFSEFLLPRGGSAPYAGITAGPDGGLWFTETSGNKIGRITTTGEFSEFLLPSGRPGMGLGDGITAGPDGALWFTERFANKIGRITTPGEFKIGRITTTGEFSEFLIPTPYGGSEITVGSDGALWFTENGGNKIGRITTAGAISEFLLPKPNSEPAGITAGPDGALWFTEYTRNKIGRITTAGEFSEFLIPTSNSIVDRWRGRAGSSPSGITVGSDSAVWFTVWEWNWNDQRDAQPNLPGGGWKIGRIVQINEDLKVDTQTFNWEKWILYVAIVASLSTIIVKRLKRLHLH